MDKNNYNINELYVKFIKRNINDQELTELKSWIAASNENKKDLWEFCKFYHALDAYTTIVETDSSKAFSKIKGSLKEPKEKVSRLFMLQRIAAALFLPVLAFSLYVFTHQSDAETSSIVYTTNPGMIAQITLNDSSKVWLNADSRLEVSKNFKTNRKVRLDGEAFFEVTKDKKHEFEVQTPHDAKITVLGTKFNVDAYGKNELVKATLEEGRVAFTYKEDGVNKNVILKPTESIVYNSAMQRVVPNQTNMETSIAWKDNRIVLKNTSMEDLSDILYKRFDVKIILKTKALSKERFTGELHTETLQSVLDYLKISSGIHYQIVEPLDKHTIVELSK